MGLNVVITVNGTADAELASADLIEVEQRMGEPTIFRLHYPVLIKDGDLPILSDARFAPGTEIGIQSGAGKDGKLECLVTGQIRAQRIVLGHGGTNSTLEVEGADIAIEMDRTQQTTVWSGATMTDSTVVSNIISTGYNLIPDVESTTGAHPEEKHSLIQRSSDYAFVKKLARRNGFIFWVSHEVLPTGGTVSTGHFKRPDMNGEDAAEIRFNIPKHNVSSFEINWDTECPSTVLAQQLDLNTKQGFGASVDNSPLDSLGTTRLRDIQTTPYEARLTTAADDAGDLTDRAKGLLAETDFFIHARCRSNTKRMGSVLHAHSTVRVRGAGRRHSGRYFVSAVTHTIDGRRHLMDMELARNAWGEN